MIDIKEIPANRSDVIAPVLEWQLLLQFGERLKRLRKAQRIGTVEMAERVGISRPTLRAVEAGDPGTAFGTYLRVMSALGIAAELALLSGEMFQAPHKDTPAARSRRARPRVEVVVTADGAGHQVQDLQSLALHEEAVRLVRQDPELINQAKATLKRWLSAGNSRSAGLWREWEVILADRTWRKVLSRTRRAQELRQASPLVTLLPDAVRQRVLAEVRALKKGVKLGQGEPSEQA